MREVDCFCGHGDSAHEWEPPPEGRGMREDAVVCNECGWQCNNGRCHHCGVVLRYNDAADGWCDIQCRLAHYANREAQ